jgi:plastocyanin
MLRSTLVLVALTAIAHAGTIRGTVIYEGEVADPAPVKRDSDAFCKKTPKTSDELIVTHGKLKDAVVRVIDGPKGAVPAAPLVLDQKECTYLPHVSAMLAGQKIAVRNSDGTFHNVRGTIGGKSIWNKPMPAGAAAIDLAPETHGGDVIEVQCDVHPWMHAFIAVEDTPMFAVTGEDGKFEITGLEIGSYTIESWHPKLGKRTMKVEIGRGARGDVNARLSYKAE